MFVSSTAERSTGCTKTAVYRLSRCCGGPLCVTAPFLRQLHREGVYLGPFCKSCHAAPTYRNLSSTVVRLGVTLFYKNRVKTNRTRNAYFSSISQR